MGPFIKLDQCLVWVHTCWKRDGVRDATVASVQASDVGSQFEVCRQGENDSPVTFFCDQLARICESHEWTLRLEDDALVNKHLWHNVSTWNVPHMEPDFGIGFLSWPVPVLNDRARIGYGSMTKAKYRKSPEMHFGGGMLYRTATLKRILPALRSRMEAYLVEHPSLGLPFSCMPSRLMHELGLRSYFHEPALVKIDLTIPKSTTGKLDPKNHGAQGYNPDWKR